jgi:hypothetical protein
MKEIKIYKAQSIGDKKAESVTIIIETEIPDINKDISLNGFYEKAHKLYKDQAESLGNALYNSLPGGTLDKLLIFFLEKKASLFKVRF